MPEGFDAYMKKVREFGKAIWAITGKGVDVDIVFEHPGEATFPVSAFVVKRGGMVVICAGTSGYNLTLDARFLWMRQKRMQGSHFANLKQASAANQMVVSRKVDPCMSEVFAWNDIPRAHEKMLQQRAPPGQHGRAGPGPPPRPAHPRRRDREVGHPSKSFPFRRVATKTAFAAVTSSSTLLPITSRYLLLFHVQRSATRRRV